MKKIIIILLFIILSVVIVRLIKSNVAENNVSVENQNREQVNNMEKLPVESDGGIGDGAPNLNDLLAEEQSVADSKPKNFSAISPQTFKKLYETGEFTAIDVRTPEEISQGKVIKDALEIDFYAADFQERLEKLDKNKKYLINCRSGSRSGEAIKLMKDMGFKEVYDLSGGIIAWRSVGFKEL